MGYSNQIILDVKPLEYMKLSIDTNDGKRYFIDLSDFKDVYCFPKSEEWEKVSIDSYGLDLIWPGRFEVHVDQLIPIAYKEEKASVAI